MSRKSLLLVVGLVLAGAGAAGLALRSSPAVAQDVVIQVYKSPSCGCCGDWVDRMREAGFTVEVHDVADVSAIKAEYGVPGPLQACHTAIVGDYVVEGHVPPDLVRRMLAERPRGQILAVPGMPAGSPGMEQGGFKDPYDVILYDRDAGPTVYASR